MKELEARPPLISVAVISAAALAYEVLLVRLLSIVQWHHFAYMIISVALLGYGVSGTFLALAQDRLRGHFPAAYVVNAACFGLTALAGFLAAQSLPFNALEVLWDPLQPLWLALIYLLLFVPFFCAANCICLALGEFGARMHLTYALDLVGAGTGAVAIIVLLYFVMPGTALKLIAACGMLAALVACLELRVGSAWPRLGLALAALGLLLPQPVPSLKISQFKGLSQALEVTGAEAIDQRSSPLGLLTTVRNERVPIRNAPGLSLNSPSGPPPQLGVFTDGDAMQTIARAQGDPGDLAYLGWLTTALPYHLLDQPRVLVLGAGVGTEVLQAQHYDVPRIDAVELNPQVVELVEQRFGEYSGRPYSDPRVRLIVADARGFVSGAEDKYDIVQVALLDAFGTSGAGLQALGENYLYTVENFRAMLRILEPGGLIAITQWVKLPPRDGLKSAAIATAALEQSGAPEPAEQMVMIRGWSTSTLLIGNRPFSSDQVRRVKSFCEARSFDLVHYPGMIEAEANRYNQLGEPWYYLGVKSMLGEQRDAFFSEYKFDVRPATDDRPYFSRFLKWSSIPEIVRLKGQGGLPLLEQGYLVLVLTLIQALVLSLVLVLLPLLRRRPGAGAGRARNLAYFFLVGTAFMMVEIAFIQKFILLLHHPIFAVATVLGTFLVFAGLGSALTSRWPEKRSVAWPVAGIGIIALAYLLLLPWLFGDLQSLSQVSKTAVAVLLIAPLALLMGMPFPLGLRRLAGHSADLVPWAWGTNGCASVISAIGATLLAIHGGFAAVVAVAVFLYGLAALFFPRPTPSRPG